MGAHLNSIQATVLGVLAMVGAVIHGTLDALVRGAGATAVRAILHHKRVLPQDEIWLTAIPYCAPKRGNYVSFFVGKIFHMRTC